jgi:2-phospho-L-lactate guanylyltransferase
MSPAAVIAIVPVKRFAAAKSRLAPLLSPAEREALSAAMLEDVLAAARAAAEIAGVVVVTAEPGVGKIAASHGAEVIDEGTDGLNGALRIAAATAMQRVAMGMLVVPSDVPQVTAGVLARGARHLRNGRTAVLAPAVADGGTNLLGLSPPEMIAPAFGPGSFARHRGALLAAGVAPLIVDDDAIGRDIDRPDDLASFLAMKTPTRTRALLVAMGVDDRLASSAVDPAELAQATP